MNCFFKMIDQQMHYYEKQGGLKLYTGYQTCSELLFAYLFITRPFWALYLIDIFESQKLQLIIYVSYFTT